MSRAIFDSWDKKKQGKYLKAHPSSKYHSDKKTTVPGGRRGRPKSVLSDKLKDANNQFNNLRGASTKRKEAFVKEHIKKVGGVVGRRLKNANMDKPTLKAAIANHIDGFLKIHAPAIHRSAAYKKITGKGSTARVRGPGMAGLAKKEKEISRSNFVPKTRLTSKASNLLKSAIKKHNGLQRPSNKAAQKEKIMKGLSATYAHHSPSDSKAHIEHVLQTHGGGHLI